MDTVLPATELALFLTRLPNEPGIYKMLDNAGRVLYVGKAANLKKRVSSYFVKNNQGEKTRSLVSQIVAIDISVTRSETEALLLESNLIKSLRPKYNILLRDDKSYPYIHLTKHQQFPRIESYRSKKKPKEGVFFGPYPSGLAVKETITTIQKVFQLRTCSDSYFNARSRPCLLYQIKRCSAPCVGYIDEKNYALSVRDATRLLQGTCQDLLDELNERMNQAVAQLHFEEAAFLRDQIKSLRMVQEQQSMVQLKGDADVIAIDARPGFACIQCTSIRDGQVLASNSFYPEVPGQGFESTEDSGLAQEVFAAFVGFYYLDNPERIPKLIVIPKPLAEQHNWQAVLTQQRGSACKIEASPRGVKARWMDFSQNNLAMAVAAYETQHATLQARYEALATVLSLKQKISRMECFDISHTQGEATIASCVVFDNQGPRPDQYRRFNITGITPGDDYAAMEQALTRRYKRLRALQSLPDLLVIDGGLGQVRVAQRVLAGLQISEVLILGIAKGPTRKAGWERYILVKEGLEFTLPEDSKAAHLLQHIRDEAHRFAITAHRKKRQKIRTQSVLEEIEGVGPQRRKALLQRFGGLRDLAKASVEELGKVPGINRALAERIYGHFHGR